MAGRYPLGAGGPLPICGFYFNVMAKIEYPVLKVKCKNERDLELWEKRKKAWLKKVYRALLLLKPYVAYKIAEMTDDDDVLRIVGHKEIPWTEMKYITYAWLLSGSDKVIQDLKIAEQ